MQSRQYLNRLFQNEPLIYKNFKALNYGI
jgi:hypothetical protein